MTLAAPTQTAPWWQPLDDPTTTWPLAPGAASHLLGMGRFAATAGETGRGKTVAVVGDGAERTIALQRRSNSYIDSRTDVFRGTRS